MKIGTMIDLKMIKERYTSKFNKDNFVIDAMSVNVDSDIDPLIEDFILELNKSADIMTIYSCEGHHEGDDAYLFFNVSDKGWDIFWTQVMPSLGEQFSTTRPELFGDAIYQMDWLVSCKDNKYNTGITIRSMLIPFLDIITWEDKKEEFWKIMSETFLKYYND